MIKRQSNLTVDHCFEMFITEKEANGLSPKSLKNYQDSINLFTAATSVHLIKEIDKGIINQYILHLKNKGLSTVSVNHYLIDVRVFLYWCMEYGYVERFKISKLRGQQSALKYFSEEELELLTKEPSNYCTYTEYRNWLIVCYILSTGIRVGTLTTLQWTDIDINNRTVTYSHLKNKHSEILPINGTILDYLRKYKATWQLDSPYVFCDKNGNQMTTDSVRQALHKLCDKLHIKRRGPHALRHSFARMYIKNGGNAFTLQQLLTHSDLSMTRRYVKLFSDDLRSNYNTYDPLQNFVNTRSKRVIRRGI